jgi:pimeloyl-ACP methyl ester carboxylesterase
VDRDGYDCRSVQPALLIWGAADRLPNVDVGAGRRLHTKWPGSQMAVIERAGHLPQVEQPRPFLDALDGFLIGLAGYTGARSR